MRRMIGTLAVFVSVLTPGGRAQEGPTYFPCIDTWAINSSSVLVAKIVEVCSSSRCGPGGTVALKVERTLKGDQGNQLKLQLDAPLDVLKDWKSARRAC